MSKWDEIKIEHIIAERKDEYSTATVQNTADFVSFARERFIAPDEVGCGYYPTICLSWSYIKPLPIEVEITADHFEFYQFADAKTDIRHFDHTPGTPVPSDLVSLLNSLINIRPPMPKARSGGRTAKASHR